MLQWATTTVRYLRKAWNKLLGLVGLSSTSEPTTGKRPRSVSDGFESYIVPIKPIRIRAVPGDLTQSCPELRRRSSGGLRPSTSELCSSSSKQSLSTSGLRPSRGTKIQWDPRNVIHEDDVEDDGQGPNEEEWESNDEAGNEEDWNGDEVEDERKARASLMRMYM